MVLVNQNRRNQLKSQVVLSLGLCVSILLIFFSLYLLKNKIYKIQFGSYMEKQRCFSLSSRFLFELNYQAQFLLSLVYQDKPNTKEALIRSKKKISKLMQDIKTIERSPEGLPESIKLQLLKLQQISGHLTETANHVFNLMERGEINKAKNTIETFIRPVLINEIQGQPFFFIDEGIAHLEQVVEDLQNTERILSTLTNAGLVVSLLVILLVSSNLTKRILHRDAEILKASEEKYRTIFNNSYEGIFITTREGEIIDANDQASRIFGCPKEELINLRLADIFFSGKNGVKIDKVISQMEKTGFYHDILRVDRKDEDFIWIDVKAGFFYLEGEELMVFHVQDITEKKNSKEERERLRAQLIQSQKMEAIGTLAGGIAHDFNNILTPILGYTELILNNLPPETKDHERLILVFKAAERAKNLVSQILTFSRQDEIEKKPVRLTFIAKEVLKLLRATLPATIEIKSEIASDMGMIIADPTQIHQVLMNLCTNARDAMPGGGVLEVSLSVVELDREFCARNSRLKPGSYARLSVKDNGFGMDSNTVARIYNPFFTTKESGKGTGMGLSVVHGIVKNHNGYINVDSKPGEGTTFYIYLPVAESISKSLRSERKESVHGGTESILLVDDETEVMNVTKETLEYVGYRVTARKSAVDALKLFQVRPDDFDLVITDQTMPHMTGASLASQLLRIRPEIPIILCSGFSEDITREQVKVLGIREFVMKPIVGTELIRTVECVLDWTLKRERTVCTNGNEAAETISIMSN